MVTEHLSIPIWLGLITVYVVIFSFSAALVVGSGKLSDYLEKNKPVYLVEFGKLNPIQYGIERGYRFGTKEYLIRLNPTGYRFRNAKYIDDYRHLFGNNLQAMNAYKEWLDVQAIIDAKKNPVILMKI